MKKQWSSCLLMATLFWTASPARGQNERAAVLEPQTRELPNRISVSAWMGFNLTASFKHLGGFPARTDPGPATGGGVNRDYDDGYVRVDSTGNNHGPGFENTTWYWGYQNASQVPGDDTIVMHSSSSPYTVSRKNLDDDPVPGFEVGYACELFRNESWRWGFEAAFAYANPDIRDGRSLTADVSVINDVFPLNGVVPPLAPYSGTFEGPAAVIGDTPTRTLGTVPGGAAITGRRELDANLYAFRLGPYVEMPLSRKWALRFGGGLAWAAVDSDFRFTETVTIVGLPPLNRSGKASDTDWLVGGYVAGSASYALSDAVGLFAGVQFNDLGKLSQEAAGKQAVLDMNAMLVVNMGLSYAF